MDREKIGLVFLSISLAVSGCASRLAYAPRETGWRGHLGFGHASGYEDIRLGESTHQVKIGPAKKDDRHDLQKFALFRAAEVTKQSGNQFFVVVHEEERVDRDVNATPLRTDTSIKETGSGVHTTTTTSGGNEKIVEQAWYVMDFRVTDDPASADGRVHGADQVIADLRYFIDSRKPN